MAGKAFPGAFRRWTISTESKGNFCVATLQHANGMHHKSTQDEDADDDQEDTDSKSSTWKSTTRQASQNDMAMVALLTDCAKQKDLHRGIKLHEDIQKQGLLKHNIFVGNTLVSMYAKCGALVKAQEVFGELAIRNVISWNTLVAGYCQHGLCVKALDCYERMMAEGLPPTAVTYACIVKACGSSKAVGKGKEIHAGIIIQGLLGRNAVLGNALVDMYAKVGALGSAQQAFDALLIKNVVSWNTLITGYCQYGDGHEALACFQQMKEAGLSPDAVTFACILKACGSIGAAEKGKEVHDEIINREFLTNNTVLGSALVDMYAKCGALLKARELFDKLRARDVVAWTGLIAGYCQHGLGAQALKCYDQMKREGVSPDALTFAWTLKACSSMGAADKGGEIHAEIVNKGFLGKSTMLRNAMVVDMYAKCGALGKAQQVLNELPARDVVSWTALITGYCHYGQGEEALNCFERMKRDGFSPDAMTYACLLKACGSIGATEKGEELHAEIERAGLLGKNVVLGSALIDMYAKCGILMKAQRAFDELLVRDVVSWSSLIAGYCEHGYGDEALRCFEGMRQDGLSPDGVIFSCILQACISIGAAEKGQVYLEMMSTRYGIVPTLEHHTYVVDLLVRAGKFDTAMAAIKRMPYSEHYPVWHAVLASCQKWGNVKFGKVAFDHAVQLEDENSAATYVIMTKIYAAAGMQEEADKIEAMRVAKMEKSRIFCEYGCNIVG